MSTTTPRKQMTVPSVGDNASVWHTPIEGDFTIIDKYDGGAQALNNLMLAVSVNAGALTAALKTFAGTDPTATDFVEVVFRHATLTNPAYVPVRATAAAAIVLSSGSTLGFNSSETGRIYVWAINNAGTLELALSRTADIFPEQNLVTTTAEGGVGTANSLTAMYSTTARSGVACRCIAKIDIQTGSTPGQWTNSPVQVQLMGPGVRRTGDVVQKVWSTTGAVNTGTTQIPADDTPPQNTEGTQFISQAIIPTNAVNILEIEVKLNLAINGAGYIISALFQDSIANALCSNCQAVASANLINHIKHRMVAGLATSTTFAVRSGPNTALTVTFNGNGGSRLFGGTLLSYIEIVEKEA